MKSKQDILAAAKAAEPKTQIEEHREAVNILREKGYTWREIADFFKKQGIQIDHTRIYRTFGKMQKESSSKIQSIQVNKISYLGVRKTKRNNEWNMLELELPSKLGHVITLIGHAWGNEGANYVLNEENEMSFQNVSLIIKSGNRFPMAYLKLEFQMKGNIWSPTDVYIMPKWEALL